MKKLFTLAMAILSFYSFPSWAENWDFPYLETTGYGQVVLKPDMAEFTVRVEESTLTAENAKKRVDSVVSKFIERLTDAGVNRDEITATNIHLSPKFSYLKSGKSELVGYQATRSITVMVNQLEDLNHYLDRALDAGINRIDSIELKVKNQKEHQIMARKAAINDANEKAESLAKGFDIELDGVWRISYNSSHTQPTMMKAMAMDNNTGISPNGYEDSKLVIRDKVTVTYKLSN
ncbi:oxidative stress defense protein [Vibrio algarum]|uniref:Oxidative stress defense protein n=1 Tax=Vibrio algarum TaxID=3020714 RepID=A0ABT4YU36_9VIBR|nr:oxidative stress defense protein [Vibrio sp. KJ40-1]MDB1124892.1 oxidative stress defense protein [Vibrio sp. KJ40-1]